MTRTIHFSVDDVIDELLEVVDSGIPLLEHPMFAFLAELNDRFGAKIDLYLFQYTVMAGVRRSLAEVPAELQDQLKKIPWLRFGPHAQDYDTPPYAQEPAECDQMLHEIFAHIDRFAGVEKRSDRVRLHYFSEAYENSKVLRSYGVTSLLLTDKKVGSHRLDESLRRQFLEQGNIMYKDLNLRRSHCRMEVLQKECGGEMECLHKRLDELLLQHNDLVLFTHAVDLADVAVQTMTTQCLTYLNKAGLVYV